MRLSSPLFFLLGLFFLHPAVAEEPPEEQKKEEEKSEQENDRIMLDTLEFGVTSTVDATARWFDRFFGDSRAFEDEYSTRGRLSVGPEWSEFDGTKVRSSFRAQVNLPHAERRFSAFVGRVDIDDFVAGEDSQRRSSVLRNVSGDSEWLVGLGFDPHQGEQSRFSINAGIRGGLRADWYTEGRYLFQYRMSDSTQIRTRSVGFWRDSDGFGVAQRLDYEQTAGDNWLGRYTIEGTRAERILGIRWHSSASIYHLYAEERAIATEIWYAGESKNEVPHRDIGIRAIHRQSWLRDWFYIESWLGMHWPKNEPDQVRGSSWLVGIEFEMWYGQH